MLTRSLYLFVLFIISFFSFFSFARPRLLEQHSTLPFALPFQLALLLSQ
jgi:hypothetical protein